MEKFPEGYFLENGGKQLNRRLTRRHLVAIIVYLLIDASFRSRGSLYNSCAPITFGLENESLLSFDLELGFRSGL